jgi:uncharacterized protein YgbK (DUF1537 family)
VMEATTFGPTFAKQDRIAAAREAKRVEVVERLAKILVREFDGDEIRFIWTYGGIPSSILVQSFEEARARAK